MKAENLDLVRGSGNVFRDVGRDNADVEQLKALLAVEIIKALHREDLTVRAAQARTGFAAADFLGIRNANLARFTAESTNRNSQPPRLARRCEDSRPSGRTRSG
jgi:hypothetical protein